ncbi:GIP [Symbiodinium pilosum]|uniref:GIP protein n=1 Tax=Symbiodinium pilosum TaxID=2952 RepID=A0A812VKE2_SYMPI|nr:GIP [Symbiodinium pilosum]
MARLISGQARLLPENTGEEDAPEARVVLELTELCPDLQYAFQVLARYPTVGPRTFHKIYEVGKISRKTVEAEFDSLPVPSQVPCSEENQEKMQRWLQDESRLVLLSWPGLVPEAGNPRQASLARKDGWDSVNKPYEVQAAPLSKGDWFPCPVVTAPFSLDGQVCVAVRSLPFAAGRFRLFDPRSLEAGPATRPLVACYERLEPCRGEMVALGAIPKTLGIRLRIPLSDRSTSRLAALLQLRFRRIGHEASSWEELPAEGLRDSSEEVLLVVREEDGLELGFVYEFQVRVGDDCRMGTWSQASHPVRFALTPPVPSEGGGLRVVEQGDTAELSWAPFRPDADLQAQLPGFRRLPIEYTLSVSGGEPASPVAVLCTTETSATVRGLRPLCAYSAHLSARWSRFGLPEEGHGALMAAFTTSGLGGSKLTAELSVRGSGSTTVARIPLEGLQPAAVTLDLDPYYLQPRLGHCKPDFVRKPSLPSSRSAQRTEEAQTSDSAAPHGDPHKHSLPSLVPMPPPKFTTRDPLSFALRAGPSSRGISNALTAHGCSESIRRLPGRGLLALHVDLPKTGEDRRDVAAEGASQKRFRNVLCRYSGCILCILCHTSMLGAALKPHLASLASFQHLLAMGNSATCCASSTAQHLEALRCWTCQIASAPAKSNEKPEVTVATTTASPPPEDFVSTECVRTVLVESPAALAQEPEKAEKGPIKAETAEPKTRVLRFVLPDGGTQDIEFENKPLGIDFSRSLPLTCKRLKPGMQGEKKEVKIGWCVTHINDAPVPAACLHLLARLGRPAHFNTGSRGPTRKAS